jgi:hypothetical protein
MDGRPYAVDCRYGPGPDQVARRVWYYVPQTAAALTDPSRFLPAKYELWLPDVMGELPDTKTPYGGQPLYIPPDHPGACNVPADWVNGIPEGTPPVARDLNSGAPVCCGVSTGYLSVGGPVAGGPSPMTAPAAALELGAQMGFAVLPTAITPTVHIPYRLGLSALAKQPTYVPVALAELVGLGIGQRACVAPAVPLAGQLGFTVAAAAPGRVALALSELVGLGVAPALAVAPAVALAELVGLGVAPALAVAPAVALAELVGLGVKPFAQTRPAVALAGQLGLTVAVAVPGRAALAVGGQLGLGVGTVAHRGAALAVGGQLGLTASTIEHERTSLALAGQLGLGVGATVAVAPPAAILAKLAFTVTAVAPTPTTVDAGGQLGLGVGTVAHRSGSIGIGGQLGLTASTIEHERDSVYLAGQLGLSVAVGAPGRVAVNLAGQLGLDFGQVARVAPAVALGGQLGLKAGAVARAGPAVNLAGQLGLKATAGLRYTSNVSAGNAATFGVTANFTSGTVIRRQPVYNGLVQTSTLTTPSFNVPPGSLLLLDIVTVGTTGLPVSTWHLNTLTNLQNIYNPSSGRLCQQYVHVTGGGTSALTVSAAGATFLAVSAYYVQGLTSYAVDRIGNGQSGASDVNVAASGVTTHVPEYVQVAGQAHAPIPGLNPAQWQLVQPGETQLSNSVAGQAQLLQTAWLSLGSLQQPQAILGFSGWDAAVLLLATWY